MLFLDTFSCGTQGYSCFSTSQNFFLSVLFKMTQIRLVNLGMSVQYKRIIEFWGSIGKTFYALGLILSHSFLVA